MSRAMREQFTKSIDSVSITEGFDFIASAQTDGHDFGCEPFDLCLKKKKKNNRVNQRTLKEPFVLNELSVKCHLKALFLALY